MMRRIIIVNAAIQQAFARILEMAMKKKERRPVVRKKAKMGMTVRQNIETWEKKCELSKVFAQKPKGALPTIVKMGIANM